MAAFMKFIFVTLLINLVIRGSCQCTKHNLRISQTDTGSFVAGKPEWMVTISNNCVCSQSNVVLDCKDFQTVEKIDPSILSIHNGQCLVVNYGLPIFESKDFTFKYAWDTSFPIDIVSSQVNCS
ncbi:hypothetical protein UlMin_035966 [Ulmus minor]